MSGSSKENSALAASIKAASSPASNSIPATESAPAASASTPSSASPFDQKLEEILTLLKVKQKEFPGWIVVGGPVHTDSMMALEEADISGVLWDSASNKIFLSSRSNGLVSLDCASIHCTIPSWQRRLVLGLLLGRVDRLPFPFAVSPNFPS